MRKKSSFGIIFTSLLFILFCVSAVIPQTLPTEDATWFDDHETSTPHWTDGGGDIPHKILSRQRVTDQAMTSNASEKVTVQIDENSNGKQVLLAYQIKPVYVTSELFLSLAVRSQRTGLQLMARVVLPYAPDSKTGLASTVLIKGGTYSTAGRWQKLSLAGFRQQLSEELKSTQIKSRQTSPAVNTQDAYIDYIILNVWSGAGVFDVYLDSLELSSVLPRQSATVSAPPTGANPQEINQNSQLVDSPPDKRPEASSQPTGEGWVSSPPVSEIESFSTEKYDYVKIDVNQLRLIVNDVPFFPRAIRHNGESLAFLRKIGFNTVWLAAPPTPEMEAEACQLGLWFVCPPPTQETDYENRFHRVLVWDTGRPAFDNSVANSASRYKQTSEHVETLRRTLRPSRPILGVPEDDMRRYSGTYDIILVGRNPVNSTLGYAMYGHWLQKIKNVMRDGRPTWVAISTQHDALLTAQWRQTLRQIHGYPGFTPDLLDISRDVPNALPVEQLRLTTYIALGTGIRGILFESGGRLDAEDQDTVHRMKTLSLINAELALIEPWLAEGQTYYTIPSDTEYVVGVVMGMRGANILIPMCLEPQAQYVPGVLASRNVGFLIKGLPSTYQTWNFTVGGVIPLPNKRVTGGVHFKLNEIPLVSTVVMTQNMGITSSLTRRSQIFGQKMAEQMRDIAEMRLRYFLQFHGTAPLQAEDAVWYDRAKFYLRMTDNALRIGDYAEAFLQAQRVIRPIELLEQRLWKQRTAGLLTPNDVPTATSFRTLDLHRVWMESMKHLQPGINQMKTGDFESPDTFRSSGWVLFPNRVEDTVSQVDLNSEAAFSGQLGLKLETLATSLQRSPAFLDSPAIHLVSPAMNLGPPGTIYEIQVWVNVPQTLLGTADGLKITCTNGGSVLAQRILETRGWQKIQMWRIVTSEKPVQIEIELGGYGKAWIDDLRVSPMVPKL